MFVGRILRTKDGCEIVVLAKTIQDFRDDPSFLCLKDKKTGMRFGARAKKVCKDFFGIDITGKEELIVFYTLTELKQLETL